MKGSLVFDYDTAWFIHFISSFCSHVAVFADKDSATAAAMDTNGDEDSDKEDISAPVKRRRVVLIEEEEEED